MQMNNEFAPVMKSSNTMETQQASIAMTAHMFQVLSAAIYQHPERACIRELSINGLDGQQMAGNVNTPLNVHLPSQLEPYFEVRDFGTGMTHEQTMKLYLTYGASTKRDSNDQVGGLGIGSKSPFAVAQSFTVTVYQNGFVRRYSVYMEEGIPQITKLTESPTTEPNGVSVRVAVPMNKIDVFIKEANRIYTHFPVKPNCNYTLEDAYDGMAVLAEEPGVFKIFSGMNNSRSINTGIVMGNIEYPINLAEVTQDLDNPVPAFLRQNIAKALIYLPIGSVNIAASRESLQLTDATKKTITDIFQKVAKEILSTFQDKIDTAKNLYEAVKMFYEALGVQNRGRMSPDGLVNLMKNLTWSGKTLLEWMVEQDESRTQVEIDPATGKPRMDWHGKPKREYKFPAVNYVNVWSMSRRNDKRLETRSSNNSSTFSLFREMKPDVLENQVCFVIEDRKQKNGAQKTVGRGSILKEIAKKFAEKGSDAANGNMYLFESQAEIDALAALHMYPADKMTVYKASDFEYAYQPSKAVRGQVKLWEAVNGSYHETKVDLSTLDEPQYYVRAEGTAHVSETLRTGRIELRDLMLLLARVVPTKHVFLFRKTVWNKIPEDWIEVTLDVVKDLAKDNPDWYIHLNRRQLCEAANNSRPRLDKMKVKANFQFDGRTVQDGFVDTIRSTNQPDPKGVNFEDNLDVFHDMFGRPQIVFADIIGRKYQYDATLLEKLLDIIPKTDKLYTRIQSAQLRAQENFKREIRKFKAKNKLLSWVDWSKVSFREVAEYLGHNVTPYTEK